MTNRPVAGIDIPGLLGMSELLRARGVETKSFHDQQVAEAAYRAGYKAALNARAGGDGWLPIESAPKDGTRILGLTSFGVEPVRWHTDSGEEYGLRDGWVGTEQDSECLPANRISRLTATCQPTHWQPLPTPPAALASQAVGVKDGR